MWGASAFLCDRKAVTVQGGRETSHPVRFKGGQVSERGGKGLFLEGRSPARPPPSERLPTLLLLMGCVPRVSDRVAFFAYRYSSVF